MNFFIETSNCWEVKTIKLFSTILKPLRRLGVILYRYTVVFGTILSLEITCSRYLSTEIHVTEP